MINKKIILSILIIGTIATIAGAGTWAAFSDAGTSSGNTITAGTLNMVLKNNGGSGDDVGATWTAPTGFKPGDSFQSKLDFTNQGSIDSHHIFFYLDNPTYGGGKNNANLMDQIIITNLQETFNGATTLNQAANVASQVGNHDNVLTLKEFCDFTAGYYTIDDQSGDGIVLQNGNQNDYSLIMGVTFSPDAGNDYQGATCGFNLRCVATQNTDTGDMVKLH